MIFKKNKPTKDKTKMTLTIIQGNITYAETDAIVNAANDRLAEGGGVCGAIFGAVGGQSGAGGWGGSNDRGWCFAWWRRRGRRSR